MYKLNMRVYIIFTKVLDNLPFYLNIAIILPDPVPVIHKDGHKPKEILAWTGGLFSLGTRVVSP